MGEIRKRLEGDYRETGERLERDWKETTERLERDLKERYWREREKIAKERLDREKLD